MQRLHSRHFDLAFTARADIRENFMLWLANVRRRVGYGFGGGSFMLTDIVSPDLVHPHFSNRWLQLFEHVGKPVLVRDPHLRLKQHERDWAAGFLRERESKNPILLSPFTPGRAAEFGNGGRKILLNWQSKSSLNFRSKLCGFVIPGRHPLVPMQSN